MNQSIFQSFNQSSQPFTNRDAMAEFSVEKRIHCFYDGNGIFLPPPLRNHEVVFEGLLERGRDAHSSGDW